MKLFPFSLRFAINIIKIPISYIKHIVLGWWVCKYHPLFISFRSLLYLASFCQFFFIYVKIFINNFTKTLFTIVTDEILVHCHHLFVLFPAIVTVIPAKSHSIRNFIIFLFIFLYILLLALISHLHILMFFLLLWIGTFHFLIKNYPTCFNITLNSYFHFQNLEMEASNRKLTPLYLKTYT